VVYACGMWYVCVTCDVGERGMCVCTWYMYVYCMLVCMNICMSHPQGDC